jgi:conjugal transfer/entry exclusion protein
MGSGVRCGCVGRGSGSVKKFPVMISGAALHAWKVTDLFNYSQNIRF